MYYYAIADIHGRFDLLQKAVTLIEEDAAGAEHQTITLGDYIDRGPQSKECIEFLMECSNVNFISLQGNHETMLVETIQTPLDPGWWMGNGGNATMASYGCKVKTSPYMGFPPIGYDPHMVTPDHVEWIASLPLYYETPHHVFVHAGIPFPDVPLDKQDRKKMQWMLYSSQDHGWWMNKHIVHGHHQFADGPHEWEGRTDLDCHAYHTGRLVVGVFDDDHNKAIRYLEVLGDDYSKDRTSGTYRVPRPSVA